jgi:hypothetical protein
VSRDENFFSIEVKILLMTRLSREEVQEKIEFAMNAACTELERNSVSPTYRLRELKEI